MTDPTPTSASLDQALAAAIERYRARHPASARQLELAAEVLPGGNTRSVLFQCAVPAGDGARRRLLAVGRRRPPAARCAGRVHGRALRPFGGADPRGHRRRARRRHQPVVAHAARGGAGARDRAPLPVDGSCCASPTAAPRPTCWRWPRPWPTPAGARCWCSTAPTTAACCPSAARPASVNVPHDWLLAPYNDLDAAAAHRAARRRAARRDPGRADARRGRLHPGHAAVPAGPAPPGRRLRRAAGLRRGHDLAPGASAAARRSWA